MDLVFFGLFCSVWNFFLGQQFGNDRYSFMGKYNSVLFVLKVGLVMLGVIFLLVGIFVYVGVCDQVKCMYDCIVGVLFMVIQFEVMLDIMDVNCDNVIDSEVLVIQVVELVFDFFSFYNVILKNMVIFWINEE